MQRGEPKALLHCARAIFNDSQLSEEGLPLLIASRSLKGHLLRKCEGTQAKIEARLFSLNQVHGVGRKPSIHGRFSEAVKRRDTNIKSKF